MAVLDHQGDAQLDPGPRAKAAGSERHCAVTGTVKPTEDMIRFVLAPDGSVVADLKRRLPGRGLWITGTRPALATAIRRKAFHRGFKRPVTVPEDLIATTENQLAQAALDALAMVHKAGLAVTGFSQVDAALAGADPVAAILHAADAAPDGARKINAALQRRMKRDGIAIARVDAFTMMQLDLAFGRSNVVHAALLTRSASANFLARAKRYQIFRTEGSDRHSAQ